MSISTIKFYPKREISDSVARRLSSHQRSVLVDGDGQLKFTTNTIITPAGNVKEVTYKSIKPGAAERAVKPTDVPELFKELQHVNLITTNACNLSCSYCYEQHDKDYGRFTVESLKQLYDFLRTCNDRSGKLFQFFGGEPLIHKQLILDFINKYRDELNSHGQQIMVGAITNGVLLTPDFISKYFSLNYVTMSISLDTDQEQFDHRELGQTAIDRIIDMIGLIPQRYKSDKLVSVRCTISMENVHRLPAFIDRLYTNGLRAIVIHPLTMSSVNGNMVWDRQTWGELRSNIREIITKYQDFEVQFSEGVGVKDGNNCMVGADMIAVDASGDYSGCHFFTNQKESVPHTILGNLLQDAVYVDRYVGFQETYDAMFETEEQCKTCNLRNFCYQCPAGNLDTGTKMFRPDDMCQKIVMLFLELQDDIVKKTFLNKFNVLLSAVRELGEQQVFSRSLTYLMYKNVTGRHLPDRFLDDVTITTDYEHILSLFMDKLVIKEHTLPSVDVLLGDYARTHTKLSIKQFYERWMTILNKPFDESTKHSEQDVANDVGKRVFYLTLLHMLLLNDKGELLERQQKIVKL